MKDKIKILCQPFSSISYLLGVLIIKKLMWHLHYHVNSRYLFWLLQNLHLLWCKISGGNINELNFPIIKIWSKVHNGCIMIYTFVVINGRLQSAIHPFNISIKTLHVFLNFFGWCLLNIGVQPLNWIAHYTLTFKIFNPI